MADLNPAQARAGLDDGRAAKFEDGIGVGGFLGGHLFRLDGNKQDIGSDPFEFKQTIRHQIGDDDALGLDPAGRAFRRRRAFQDPEILDQIQRRHPAQKFVIDKLRFRLALARLNAGPGFVPGHVQRLEDVLELFIRRDSLFHLVAQLDEITLLFAQDFLAGQGAVAGTDELHVELHGSIQDANPRRRVGMAHIVEGTVGASIASAEDFVLGQIHEGVAGRVGMAQE